jgi:hypothetical protein
VLRFQEAFLAAAARANVPMQRMLPCVPGGADDTLSRTRVVDASGTRHVLVVFARAQSDCAMP